MKITKSSDVELKAVEMEGVRNTGIRWLISKDDGADNIAMRMFELQPGGHTPLHTHPHEHEVFGVEGEGVFVFEGKEYPFGRDYAIFVPGGREHQFKNVSDSVMKMLCIIPASAG